MEQKPGADLESLRYPLDIVDGYIAFAAFNAAVICPIHLDLMRKILLTDAARQAEPADICRQCAPKQTRMGAFHIP